MLLKKVYFRYSKIHIHLPGPFSPSTNHNGGIILQKVLEVHITDENYEINRMIYLIIYEE